MPVEAHASPKLWSPSSAGAGLRDGRGPRWAGHGCAQAGHPPRGTSVGRWSRIGAGPSLTVEAKRFSASSVSCLGSGAFGDRHLDTDFGRSTRGR